MCLQFAIGEHRLGSGCEFERTIVYEYDEITANEDASGGTA